MAYLRDCGKMRDSGQNGSTLVHRILPKGEMYWRFNLRAIFGYKIRSESGKLLLTL